MMEKRYGKIFISRDMIENEPEVVAEIFSELKAIVVRCDCNYPNSVFEYTIYSPYFEYIGVGAIIPTYIIVGKETYDEDDESYETKIVVSNQDTQKQAVEFIITSDRKNYVGKGETI